MKFGRRLRSGGSVLFLSRFLCLVKRTSRLHRGVGGAGTCWLRGREGEGKPEFRKGEAVSFLSSSFKDKAPIDPHPTTRVYPSSEVTCLSPKLQGKGGGAAKDGVSGTGWGSPLLLDRITSLWAELWP